MTKVTASKARENLSDILNRVTYAGERVIIHRRGKELVAIVSIEDLRLIEKLSAGTKKPRRDKTSRS